MNGIEKKILFVSNTANFSKFNRPFMQWCKNNNYYVCYAAPDDDEILDCDKHFVISIPRSPFSKGILRSIKQLREIIEENRFDIIHCHTPMGGVISRIAARKLFMQNSVKIIYTAHGFHFYKGAPLLNWVIYYNVERFLLRYTTTLVTINKEDYEFSKKHFSKLTNVEYMNGVGVNLKRFNKISYDEQMLIRDSLGYGRNDFIITVVAELNKNKNQAMLINSIKKLASEILCLKVLFIGRETLTIARDIVDRLKLNEICFFLGYRKDVDLFTKISNICFSASLREGLPVNIIEGMACGKVCVCSKNRGHNSLIRNGVNGLLFDPNNSKEMEECILEIYKDNGIAEKLANNALVDSEQYDVAKAIECMSNIYKKMELKV